MSQNTLKSISPLQKLRVERNLSQSELAKLSGVNFRTLQDFDQGRKSLANAKGEMIYRLSIALGCTSDELLADSVSTIDIEPFSMSDATERVSKYYNFISTERRFNMNGINSRRINRGFVFLDHAEQSFSKINESNIYISFCCFYIYQCAEQFITGIINENGLDYALGHHLKPNLSILKANKIHIPHEDKLYNYADTISEWDEDIMSDDDFDVPFSVISELLEYLEDLQRYIISNYSK